MIWVLHCGARHQFRRSPDKLLMTRNAATWKLVSHNDTHTTHAPAQLNSTTQQRQSLQLLPITLHNSTAQKYYRLAVTQALHLGYSPALVAAITTMYHSIAASTARLTATVRMQMQAWLRCTHVMPWH
jgi:hypothetical protein